MPEPESEPKRAPPPLPELGEPESEPKRPPPPLPECIWIVQDQPAAGPTTEPLPPGVDAAGPDPSRSAGYQAVDLSGTEGSDEEAEPLAAPDPVKLLRRQGLLTSILVRRTGDRYVLSRGASNEALEAVLWYRDQAVQWYRLGENQILPFSVHGETWKRFKAWSPNSIGIADGRSLNMWDRGGAGDYFYDSRCSFYDFLIYLFD